jgi:RNA polymerase sigma-70 factor (sigma-E family)
MSEDFEAFVEVETPRLLGLAHALTGNPHDAWDLVQESLTRVGVRWRRLGSDNPGGYARTTLVRLNIDLARRLRRELLPGVVPDREAPVEIVDQVDPWLVEALGTLTPQQRAAVVLRVLEDLDHAGIAERLGCSVGTARSHLSRGLSGCESGPRPARKWESPDERHP